MSTSSNALALQDSHYHHYPSLASHGMMGMDMSNDTDMMPMYFEWSTNINHVLFEFWTVKTPVIYVITLAIFFVASILNQFLFWVVKTKVTYKAEGYEAIDAPNSAKKIFWILIKPIAFMVQNALSYLIMLVVMTFNVGLFISIVLGSTVGYAIFSLPSGVAPSEGCH